MEFPKNDMEKREMEKSAKEYDSVTSMDDHKRIIRAQLTGAELPPDVMGKKINPVAFGEEKYLMDDVKEELTAEGYTKNEKGVWVK